MRRAYEAAQPRPRGPRTVAAILRLQPLAGVLCSRSRRRRAAPGSALAAVLGAVLMALAMALFLAFFPAGHRPAAPAAGTGGSGAPVAFTPLTIEAESAGNTLTGSAVTVDYPGVSGGRLVRRAAGSCPAAHPAVEATAVRLGHVAGGRAAPAVPAALTPGLFTIRACAGRRAAGTGRRWRVPVAHVDDEIASQPGCWIRAAALAGSVAAALPVPGERVAVVGCGTSWFMAMAYAGLREAAGHGETDAFPASEFPAARRYDRIVVITRSGTTTEVLDVLRVAGAPTTAIVGDPDSPAVGLAGQVVRLPFADERSVVQTRFATTALTLLRGHLGERLDPAVEHARAALSAPLPVDPARVEQVTFLGRGWTVGLAYEAALKCREAAGCWAEAYPAMDYRHGPISIAAPGRVVWAFGALPGGLAEQIAGTGAALVAPDGDPVAALILAQRLAVGMAAARGLDPDRPRHLTRSVILPDSASRPAPVSR